MPTRNPQSPKMISISREDLVSQYHLVSERRSSGDSLLWQAPSLSLTAQAFLFTTVLDNDSTHFDKITASFLAILISVGSVHLLWKHRLFELRDSFLLNALECKLALLNVNARPVMRFTGKSYKFWVVLLASFGIAAWIVFDDSASNYFLQYPKSIWTRWIGIITGAAFVMVPLFYSPIGEIVSATLQQVKTDEFLMPEPQNDAPARRNLTWLLSLIRK